MTPTARMRRYLAAVLAAVLIGAAAPPAFAAGDDVIGIPGIVETSAEDTLLDLARQYDVGYVEIRAANPDLDPWLPGAGKRVVLPTQHVLPAGPRQGIVINLAELRLYYFPPRGGMPRSFPIGIGREGAETPTGRTQVARKMRNPAWYPTKSEREEKPELPAMVPPGPDNPMGEFALYLGWPSYAIHGTDKPYSVGRRGSHGCIRMYPEDVAELFSLAAAGTAVTVVDQPAKIGWSSGELYLEVHPTQAEADLLESDGRVDTLLPADIDDLIAKAAGAELPRVDWYAAHLAAQQRSGVAVAITRPASPT